MSPRCRISSRRSSARSWTPAVRRGWVHEIKFDGYRIQLRVAWRQGRRCGRARGSTGRRSFAAIAKAARRPARLPHRWRGGGARRQWRAGFRGAAGRAVGGQERRSRLFRLRSAVRRQGGPARPAAVGAQGAACKLCWPMPGSTVRRIRYRRAFRDRWRRGAAIGLQAARWRASSPSSSMRPIVPGRSDSWTKAKCRAGHEVVIGGWSDDGRASSARCWSACIAASISSMSAASAPAMAARAWRELPPKLKALASKTRPSPAWALRAHAAGCALAEARACRRNRVRRLDRRRHGAPGGLQGPARGQAGGGGGGGKAGAGPTQDAETGRRPDMAPTHEAPRKAPPSP